ncbi:MAG: hypothetical protein ABIA93_07590 [Candidatus Woesearchaeota archaeon]
MGRGQVTIFVILGILILLIFGLAVVLTNLAKENKPTDDDIVTRGKPITSLVETCLGSLLDEGLADLGRQGGSLNLNGMRISPDASNSDAFIYPPYIMPYWSHLTCPTCIESEKPPLCKKDCPVIGDNGRNSVEEQLAEYITSHIDECIQNITSMPEFDITVGKKTTTVTITRTNVLAELEMPVTARSTDSTIKLNRFIAQTDVRLADIWRFAKDVMDAEQKYGLFEESTLQVMSPYMGTHEGACLPPMRDVKFLGGAKTWYLVNVKDCLDNDILPYLGLMQFTNTNDWTPLYSLENSEYSEYSDGVLQYLLIKTSNTTHDVNARLTYPSGNLYLDFGQGYVLKPRRYTPQGFFAQLTGILLNDYRFQYSMTFPLILTVTDPDAYDGQGYSLNIAFQANIRNNRPILADTASITTYGTPMVNLDDETQMPNRTYILKTYDQRTGLPLSNVGFEYQCGDSFSIGTSDADGVLTTKLPYCAAGGVLRYMSKGYQGNGLDLNNPDGEDTQTITVQLWPTQTLNVQAFKRTVTDVLSLSGVSTGGIFALDDYKHNLSENDTLMISIEKVNNDLYEEDVPQVGFGIITKNPPQIDKSEHEDLIKEAYQQGQINASTYDELMDALNLTALPKPPTTTTTFDLVPGTYNITLTILTAEGLHIPPKDKKVCADEIIGLICTKHKTVHYPLINESVWISGASSTILEVGENELYNSGNLTLYVLEMPVTPAPELFDVMPELADSDAGKEWLKWYANWKTSTQAYRMAHPNENLPIPMTWDWFQIIPDLATYQQGKEWVLTPTLQ